jgi:hypothetical protein
MTTKAIYLITSTATGKSRWLVVGVAFPNKDGSYNLKFDVPLDITKAQLQLRDRFPRERADDGASEQAPA